MTTDPDPLASPACLLHEADELYAGFARPEEIQAQLQAWVARAPAPDIAARLMTLLRQPAATPATTMNVGSPLTLTALGEEMSRFLPKIRDNELHRALAEIAQAL